jgi:SAM-dependent methyltransferase
MDKNLDPEVVEAFGHEWSRFDQSEVPEQEQIKAFEEYFAIFPWQKLPKDAVGFDLGCGSGRWAKLVAPRVGHLHCIDPSLAALNVAKRNCFGLPNCTFHLAGVDDIPLENESMDFCYCLGVLHHIPDTEKGIESCVAKLKMGAPLLLYLYYRFDNRAWWFKVIWRISEIGRFVISRLPYSFRYLLSQPIALFVYLPLARFSLLLERLGFDVDSFPLSAYRNSSFYSMRTDALDRFGTKLEKRFTKTEIAEMMERAGLDNIVFSDSVYWCAVGYRK